MNLNQPANEYAAHVLADVGSRPHLCLICPRLIAFGEDVSLYFCLILVVGDIVVYGLWELVGGEVGAMVFVFG